MDRSDPPRSPAAKPAAAKTEAELDAAPADVAPAADTSADEGDYPLLPAEADAVERAHFETLERETTHPVRSYAFRAPTEEIGSPEPAAPAPDPEPQSYEVETTRAPAFEPAPFAVLPPKDRPEPVVPQRAPFPAPIAYEPRPPEPIAPEPIAPEPTAVQPPIQVVPVPPAHAYEAPAARVFSTDHNRWSERIAVPPPIEAVPPPLRAPFEPELPAGEPYGARQAPLTLDQPSWETRHERRVEPVFETGPLPPPATLSDVEPAYDAAPHRDWRDLVRRAASVAVLVFAGWLVAVLLLIVAYRFVNPQFSMLMAQRFLGGTMIDKQWVPIDRISSNLARAVIVSEDGRFCQHWGVDFIEAANAIRRSSIGYPRGASTITMQVAKNLFLVPTKSYLRKMIEIPLTFAIELVWPKRRILEIYLNIVEWGPGVFGAEAASRAHFGRSAASLTPRQAAQLAAVLPNPIARDAGAPGRRTANKASIIQARAARTREASACVDPRR